MLPGVEARRRSTAEESKLVVNDEGIDIARLFREIDTAQPAQPFTGTAFETQLLAPVFIRLAAAVVDDVQRGGVGVLLARQLRSLPCGDRRQRVAAEAMAHVQRGRCRANPRIRRRAVAEGLSIDDRTIIRAPLAGRDEIRWSGIGEL